MNTIPSTRFRKVYSTLLAPTIVTANGHPIGTWHPLGTFNADELGNLHREESSAVAMRPGSFGHPVAAPKPSARKGKS